MNKNDKNGFNRIAGYTIDQTILIVAVIAILITLIIASVGWDLLQRTGGTKVASQLKQIEESNGRFLSQHGVWPVEAGVAVVTGAETVPESNITVLLRSANINADYQDEHRNLLPSISIVGDVAQHGFGIGGSIEQTLLAAGANAAVGGPCDDSDDRIVITLNGVPTGEVERANLSIDGENEAAPQTTGRLRWSAPVAGRVNVMYCANVVDQI